MYSMTLEIKPRVILTAGLILLFACVVAVLLRILPAGRRPVDYLVAGTFATALTLLAIFVLALKRR